MIESSHFLILENENHFNNVIEIIDNLMDEEEFKRKHGFSTSEYIAKGMPMINKTYRYVLIILYSFIIFTIIFCSSSSCRKSKCG